MSAEFGKVNLLITDPAEVTTAVREVIEDGRRVVGMRSYPNIPYVVDRTLVVLDTLPAHKRIPGQMRIPNQDQPHAIFESVAPIEE